VFRRSAQGSDEHRARRRHQVSAARYPGIQSAVISGSLTTPGQPYVQRNKFSPGTFSPPHFHPETRYVVVLKGTWWVGFAQVGQGKTLRRSPPGSFVVHHAEPDPLRRREGRGSRAADHGRRPERHHPGRRSPGSRRDKLAQFGAHDGGALGEGFQLAERRLARRGTSCRSRARPPGARAAHARGGAEAARDFLGALHSLGAEVDHAQGPPSSARDPSARRDRARLRASIEICAALVSASCGRNE